MAWFKRKKKPTKRFIREIAIQGTEGASNYVMIESLLTGVRFNVSVPGTINVYNTYESQVTETYRKYNALSSFGNQQVRAVVDLRTAFIAGEGISISCEDEQTSNWIETLLARNLLQGPNFINAVKGSEMAGHALFVLEPSEWFDKSLFIKIIRFPYTIKEPFKPVFKNPRLKDEVLDIVVKKEFGWQSANLRNFIYIRTGGDDGNTEGPCTKIGVVLTDMENYDRAIKDMRRNNHIFARITPTWKTKTATETTSLKSQLNEKKWKIGDAVIGSAEFEYKVPKTGAHENLTSEMVASIKTISSVTGVPVHWLGYVDLMSNRSTAETLYELIKNATILERQFWQNSLYNMIIKAQELYIDAGGEDISKLNYNFEVRLPLINFGEFLNRVKGLQIAYMDEAISIDDYRNMLPGIDPLKTKRALENEEEKEKEKIMDTGQQQLEEGE
ncbi:MAG: hypothetical protein ACTSPI_00400 [Candidatus Heimdallarchaeaceae archaeon]